MIDRKEDDLHHFWEANFQEKREMWGFVPAQSARMAAALFKDHGLDHILIPGLGYGRNAQPFLDHGMKVTGIEISETAISLAKKYFTNRFQQIYHGSVEAMPFDKQHYDGIFCYSLIHLLSQPARSRLIQHCYAQLRPGGYMIFVAVSKHFPGFKKGKMLSKDRYQTAAGVALYFYDHLSIEQEFDAYGLKAYQEIAENGKENAPSAQAGYWYILCQK